MMKKMVFACYFTRFFYGGFLVFKRISFFAHVFPLMKCNILVPIHFDKSRYIEHKVFIHTYIHMFIKKIILRICVNSYFFPLKGQWLRKGTLFRNVVVTYCWWCGPLSKCCPVSVLMLFLFFSFQQAVQTNLHTGIHTNIRTCACKRIFLPCFFRNTVKWYLRGFFHSISFWFIHSFARSFSALHYDVMMSVVDINFHNDDQTTIKKTSNSLNMTPLLKQKWQAKHRVGRPSHSY